MIAVGKQVPLFTPETLTQLELTQNYRNLIHPGKTARSGERCGKDTALGALSGLERSDSRGAKVIAAINARRSKRTGRRRRRGSSVNRKVENARVFATGKGWTVLEEHIYIDDITGASTVARLRAEASAVRGA